MRVLLAILAAAALLGGTYLTLQHVRPPELRIALNLRAGNANDGALAAGADFALKERDFRAGRWRLKTAHQTLQPGGILRTPRPGPHAMIPGIDDVPVFSADQVLLPPSAWKEAEAIRSRLRMLGLKRLGLPFGSWRSRPAFLALLAQQELEAFSFRPVKEHPASIAYQILQDRPEALYFHPDDLFAGVSSCLREQGFAGPIFVGARDLASNQLDHPRFQGCLLVLAPMEAAFDGFTRRFNGAHAPHLYAGYRATLRYLDHLELHPDQHPFDASLELMHLSIFDELLGEPRIYRVEGGRLHPAN